MYREHHGSAVEMQLNSNIERDLSLGSFLTRNACTEYEDDFDKVSGYLFTFLGLPTGHIVRQVSNTGCLL